jgi:hypothetical protein
MNSKPPPVPDENRSHKGTGDTGSIQTDGGADQHFAPQKDPNKLGQQGNSKVNTTNQGYQQDR